jgi:hypothetical protein
VNPKGGNTRGDAHTIANSADGISIRRSEIVRCTPGFVGLGFSPAPPACGRMRSRVAPERRLASPLRSSRRRAWRRCRCPAR